MEGNEDPHISIIILFFTTQTRAALQHYSLPLQTLDVSSSYFLHKEFSSTVPASQSDKRFPHLIPVRVLFNLKMFKSTLTSKREREPCVIIESGYKCCHLFLSL